MPITAEFVAGFRAGWENDAEVNAWVMGRDGGAIRATEGGETYTAGRWVCDAVNGGGS